MAVSGLLQNKAATITTKASGGIGRTTALRFAKEGVRLCDNLPFLQKGVHEN
jgi:NAD(P)-dependent dehydrogenase (short-subunit alcohol dehydrogenase family)